MNTVVMQMGLVLLVSTTALAQAGTTAQCSAILPSGAIVEKNCEHPDAETALNPAGGSRLKPTAAAPSTGSKAADAYQEWETAYYKYQTKSLDEAASAYHWHHRASIIIFWVVIFLVFSGLMFSALQFHMAMTAKGNQAVKPEHISSIEAGIHGVKIKSSIIGLLILIISMGFFYLYLAYVYPIIRR